MQPPVRRPTLADVAAKAGTSTAVVSYVVNNGPRQVAPATRERVERAIGELGYRRNPIAGALSVGRSNMVGLLVPDTANGFFGELSRCFESEGRLRGYMTLLGNTGYDATVAEEYVLAFSDLRPRGIFTTSVAPGVVTAPGAPLVFIHSIPGRTVAPSVRFDDVSGARTAVEHLIGHGFTDIHCLGGEHTGDPASLRAEGWRQAMSAAGLPTEGRLHRASFDRVAAEAEVRRMLGREPWPRAIFATTDEQALAVLRAVVAVGARVPDDIAVVGFDGIREATLGSVRLTTVRVPVEALAAHAFDILEAPGGDESAQVVLPGELVLGDTCGCGADGLAGENSVRTAARS